MTYYSFFGVDLQNNYKHPNDYHYLFLGFFFGIIITIVSIHWVCFFHIIITEKNQRLINLIHFLLFYSSALIKLQYTWLIILLNIPQELSLGRRAFIVQISVVFRNIYPFRYIESFKQTFLAKKQRPNRKDIQKEISFGKKNTFINLI